MTKTNENGRPTKQEQLDLQKTLHEYYEKGISATTTANLTEINVKTVCKYFNEWHKQINEIERSKFQDRVLEARSQHMIVLDNQLDNLYKLQYRMQEDTMTVNGIHSYSHNYNFRERLATIKMILGIMETKEELLKPLDKNVVDVTKN